MISCRSPTFVQSINNELQQTGQESSHTHTRTHLRGRLDIPLQVLVDTLILLVDLHMVLVDVRIVFVFPESWAH